MVLKPSVPDNTKAELANKKSWYFTYVNLSSSKSWKHYTLCKPDVAHGSCVHLYFEWFTKCSF